MAVRVAPLALLLGSSCVDDDKPKDDMAMGAPDLAASQRDLAAPAADLAVNKIDMAGTTDLAGVGDLAVTSDLAIAGDLAGPGDLGIKPDLASASDMAGRPDLSSPPDLSLPPADLAGGHVVTGLPTCTTVGVSADMVFLDVARASCASGMCHNAGAAGLTFSSGATLKSALVGVASKQTTLMPLVTASNVDASYLMYKLTGQHTSVGGRGELMPKGGTRLTDANLCKFIVWIKEGAK